MAVYSVASPPANDICIWCRDQLNNGQTVVGHDQPPKHQYHYYCLLDQMNHSDGAAHLCGFCQAIIDRSSLQNIQISGREWKDRQIQKFHSSLVSFKVAAATEIFLTSLAFIAFTGIETTGAPQNEIAYANLVACIWLLNAWIAGMASAAFTTTYGSRAAIPLNIVMVLMALYLMTGWHAKISTATWLPVSCSLISTSFAEKMKTPSFTWIAALAALEGINLLAYDKAAIPIPWHITCIFLSGLLAAGINFYSNSR